MLAPIPNIGPSFLYSRAAEVIEWAKPVIGIIRAAFTLVTSVSNIPIAVRIEAIAINDNVTMTPDSFLGKLNQIL